METTIRPRKIVAIDDEPEICWLISRILEGEGYQALIADHGAEGLELIRREHPDLVLLDLRLPGMDGLEVLRRLREFDREQMVIILSAFESFEAAVGAMKLGAYDFLTKPINVEEMKITLKNALQTKHLTREVEHLKRQVAQVREVHSMVGECPAMLEVLRQVELTGGHSINALILGESGTGKELIAQAIHARSGRANQPFVALDCSTIPENLVESELFGCERGAYTGAQERRLGRLELANGGTLFLDEISNMPMAMQAKLLRVLQERTLQRLGGKTDITIDIRLIAATNLDLRQQIAKGLFREDLFYRLNEFPITLPPLRERGEDIEILAKYFLDRFSQEYQKPGTGISGEAMRCLRLHHWPGNVRELQAAIKRAVILASGQVEVQHLPAEVRGTSTPDHLWSAAAMEEIRPIKEVSREVVAQVERELILRTLAKSGGNKIKTARLLEIDYKTLFNKLKQYQIEGFGRGVAAAQPATGGMDCTVPGRTT